MRMLMDVCIPVGAGNAGITNGKLNEVLQSTIEKINPEAAYFTVQDGMRAGYFIFDMADTSEMPGIAEPLFQAFDAKISFRPVMNLDDLQKGLGQS